MTRRRPQSISAVLGRALFLLGLLATGALAVIGGGMVLISCDPGQRPACLETVAQLAFPLIAMVVLRTLWLWLAGSGADSPTAASNDRLELRCGLARKLAWPLASATFLLGAGSLVGLKLVLIGLLWFGGDGAFYLALAATLAVILGPAVRLWTTTAVADRTGLTLHRLGSSVTLRWREIASSDWHGGALVFRTESGQIVEVPAFLDGVSALRSFAERALAEIPAAEP